MVNIATVQSFATQWQQKSYQRHCARATGIETLATNSLSQYVQGQTDSKPLIELKEIEKAAYAQTFSWMRSLACKIALWVTRFIFRSHHAYYAEMLALDLKMHTLTKISKDLRSPHTGLLHERVMAGQLCLLSKAYTKSEIDQVYKDIHAAFSLGKVVSGLIRLNELDTDLISPEMFDLLDVALKDALIEIAGRANRHDLADQIRPLTRLNPVVFNQLREGEPSLIALALADYEALLKALYMQYGLLETSPAFSESVEKLHRPGALARVMNAELSDIYQAGIDRIASPGQVSAIATKLKETQIRVTHVGVEYASFLKQGGLGEALEGLAEAMQSEGAQVRVLFPLYSSIQETVSKREDAVKGTFINADGDEVVTYTIHHRGVEVVFISHEDFALDKQSPNIYDGDIKSRSRFARFCQCASSWLYQNRDQFDVIHLHDWHVATIAKTLATDYPQAWKEGKMPCVFTAHNNSRAAQGRCSDELAVGAYAYGLALNPMLEGLRWSDMVTTVSEVFAREMQAPERGEGIDPVMRHLALGGRLVGILNGSNPGKWDPSKDAQLANWSPQASPGIDSKRYDLRCSSADPAQVLEKKSLAKALFAEWIEQQRPLLTAEDKGKQLFNSIDPHKPLFGVVTRYDSYQKGLDFYEAMIGSVLAEGGQIALVGSQEDMIATKILDALVKKYEQTAGVVIIRDEKLPNGKYRFQNGSDTTPGIGSVARLAFDVMFMTPKYEPSGLTQFEGWGYGSLVLASATGGLKESVTTPEQSADAFTGWLFNRALGAQDLRRSVNQAMTYFTTATPQERASKVAAVMQEAKMYGWANSERRASPVNQYFTVYSEAIQRAKNRTSRLSHRIMDRFKTADLGAQEALARLNPEESQMALDAFIGAGNKAAQAVRSPLARLMPIAFGKGVCRTLHEQLGPQRLADGTYRLTVMAPNAQFVSVVIYNDDGSVKSVFPLEKYEGGVWQTGLDLPTGTKYRLYLDGNLKIDPYARHNTRLDHRQPMYSVLYHDEFKWTDSSFIQTRGVQNKLESATILEVYPQTWASERKLKTWVELAPSLIAHAKAHGYSHIELMGVLNFPYIKSMGYQPTSHFATDYRLGTPEDFKALVNALHEAGLFVIVDFIPGHVAKDQWGMGSFDGSPLYEISGLQKLSFQALGFRWGHHMNLGSDFVQAHLLSSVKWLLDLHVDGLRIDAVRSMLNHYDSAAAKRFLQHLNALTHEYPGCLTIAEDYSNSEIVLKPQENGGIGCNGRWNVGWKHHALRLLSEDPDSADSHHLLELIRLQSGKDAHREVKYISHDELAPKSESLLERVCVSRAHKGSKTLMEKYAKLAAFIALSRLLPGPSLMMTGADTFSDYRWRCADPNVPGEEETSPASEVTVQAAMESRSAFFKKLQETLQLIGEQVSCTLKHSQNSHSAATYELRGKNMTVLVIANFSSRTYVSKETSLAKPSQNPLSLRVERVLEAGLTETLMDTSEIIFS